MYFGEIPKVPRLWNVITFEPLGVERWLSPFWKAEKQDIAIFQREKKLFFDPEPPPPVALTLPILGFSGAV